jgi:O-antigen/teichoic acid export membrane protein
MTAFTKTNKLYNFVLKNDFLRSSAVIFIANLSVGVLNYVLVIFASRMLAKGDYSVWTALTGIFSILATFNTGLFTEVNKKFSSYTQHAPSKAIGFYNFLMHKAKKLLLIGVLLSPLAGYLLWIVSDISIAPIHILLVITVFLSIYTGLNRYLLVGMLYNLKFGTVTIFTGFARLIPTVILFKLGLGVWALPIGLIISQVLSYLIANKFVKDIIHSITPSKSTYEFALKPHLVSSFKSTIILFCLSAFINVAPVISEKVLSTDERDLFAVLFSFGQIIHFGSTAFTQAIIVHASRSAGQKNNNEHKIYYFSVALMLLLTSTIGAIFYFFGEFMLSLFGKSEYIDKLSLILFYSLFILTYNIIFISVQYLISHSRYKALYALPVLVVLLVVSIYIAGSNGGLEEFLRTQVWFGGLSAVLCFLYIWRSKSKPDLKT